MPLRHALREAVALGAKFRMSGAAVSIEGITALPQRLCEALRAHQHYLWDLIDNGTDREPIELLDNLGVEPVLAETRYQARQAVRQIITDLAEHGPPIGLDIETSPRPEYAQPRPCAKFNANGCISDAQPPRKAYQDPAGTDPHRSDIALAQLYAGGKQCFVFRSNALWMLLLSHWLRRQHLVAHNLGFELSFLAQCGYQGPVGWRRVRSRLDCTEQAAGLVIGIGHGGENRGLANAALALLGITVPKEHQLSDWGAAELSGGQIAYAAIDAILAYRLWQRLIREFSANDLWGAYRLQRNAIPAVVDMQARGLKLDREEHARQIELWSRDLAKARHRYAELTGEPPPGTDADVRRWLEANLPAIELDRWRRTPSGQLSVDKDDLAKLGHLPAARPILDLRARERLLQTFGPKMAARVSPATGRIHASFLIAATKAGRFSCRNPNLQNLPRDPAFRQCIVAEDGYILLCADYSQIELRVAAYESRDAGLTRVFAEGGDVHAESASRITGAPAWLVTKEQRQGAKAVSFGALYGQGAQGLADTAYARFGVEMDLADAQAALNGFFSAYPELHRHLQHNAQISQRRGYVRIGCGRLVRAEWEFGRISYQQSCNLPIQGGAADLMLLAIKLVHQQFRKAGIRGGLIATIHDELLAEIRQDDAEISKEIMHREMTHAFELAFPGAPTTGLLTVNSGRNWKEAKEEDAPEDHPETTEHDHLKTQEYSQL
jgi:DNA polymerase-1